MIPDDSLKSKNRLDQNYPSSGFNDMNIKTTYKDATPGLSTQFIQKETFKIDNGIQNMCYGNCG